MSDNTCANCPEAERHEFVFKADGARPDQNRFGGARRDRTDDLMLAKHALSQLSYGPGSGRHFTTSLGGDGGPGKT